MRLLEENPSADSSAKASAALALMNEIEDAATQHYAKFGSYPMSLDELTVAPFSDGGNRELLDGIGFQPNEETMTIEWVPSPPRDRHPMARLPWYTETSRRGIKPRSKFLPHKI